MAVEKLILDVGCGKRKRGDIGIDYGKDSDADVIGDAEHLPFKGETFAKVVSVVALEHSPNPLNFIKEQYRVLKKGGQIELVTDNAQYFRWSVLKFRGGRHEDFHSDHYMIFYPKNVVRLIQLAGFEGTSSCFINMSPTKIGVIVKLLVRLGIFRDECQYGRFKVSAVKHKNRD